MSARVHTQIEKLHNGFFLRMLKPNSVCFLHEIVETRLSRKVDIKSTQTHSVEIDLLDLGRSES